MAHVKPAFIPHIHRGKLISNGLRHAWPMQWHGYPAAVTNKDVAGGYTVSTVNNAANLTITGGLHGAVLSSGAASDSYFYQTPHYTLDAKATISLWLRKDTTLSAGQGASIIQIQGHNSPWTFAGQIVFRLFNNSGTERLELYTRLGNDASAAIVDQVAVNNPGVIGNGWFHLALVANGSNWLFYKNAVKQSTSVITGSDAGYWIDNLNEAAYGILLIAVRNVKLDDARIYARDLSQQEIARIYAGHG